LKEGTKLCFKHKDGGTYHFSLHGRKGKDDNFQLAYFGVTTKTRGLFTDSVIRTSNITPRLRMQQVSFPQYIK